MLLRGAPAGWAASCEAKINGWGAAAKGTTRLSVRIVARTSPDEVWLAYRCGSRLLDLRRHYSERLGLFMPAKGTIQYFALDEMAGIGAGMLSRIKVTEGMRVENARGLVLRLPG
jgi:hypothetical protein